MDEKTLTTLKAVPLFMRLAEEPQSLAHLASFIQTRYVPQGVALIQEGDMGTEMFILQHGRVEVTKTTLHNEQYTVAELDEESHPFFGEMALLDDDRRSATITTLTDCEVLVLDRNAFIQMGDTNPQVGLLLMRELSKKLVHRLRTTNADVVMLFEALVKEVTSEEIS